MNGVAPLSDGGRLSFRVTGDVLAALPILLLRPFGGSMALWGAFEERLARQVPVIAFDPRGVGDSSPCPFGVTTRSMAEDALALLDHLAVPRAHVFGLSLGGMVASWLAIDHPERIARLILASTLPRWGTISFHGARKALALLACLLVPEPRFEGCLMGKILSPGFAFAYPLRVREIERAILDHPTGKADLVALLLAAARHGAAPGLFRERIPTLLLVGAVDPIMGARSQNEYLLGLPDAKLEVVPDSGHDLTLEQPIHCAERVLNFLG